MSGGRRGQKAGDMRSENAGCRSEAAREGGNHAVLEDVLLRAVLPAVEVVVVRCLVGAFEHLLWGEDLEIQCQFKLFYRPGTDIVALLLVPVHGPLGTDRAVSGCCVGTAVVRVSTAAASESGLAQRLGANVPGHFALESVHVHWNAKESVTRTQCPPCYGNAVILCSEPLSI